MRLSNMGLRVIAVVVVVKLKLQSHKLSNESLQTGM